jgi:hypothetical protein
VQNGDEFADHELTLDRAAAEEALMIAAMLQHEQCERLSLNELKRTAAEVDISPEFVEQAILLMSRRKTIAPKKIAPETTPMTLTDLGFILMLVVLQSAVFLALAWRAPFMPFCVSAIAIAGSAGFLIPKSRRGAERLKWSFFGAIVALSLGCFAARYAFERNMLLTRGSIALAIEAAAFFGAQYLRIRSEAKSANADQQVQIR